jgi:hypothetical protein
VARAEGETPWYGVLCAESRVLLYARLSDRIVCRRDSLFLLISGNSPGLFVLDSSPRSQVYIMVSVTEMITARATMTPTVGPIPDWGPTILAVSISLPAFALILVLLRLITRWRISQLGWDDFFIVLAIVSCLPVI